MVPITSIKVNKNFTIKITKWKFIFWEEIGKL